MELTLDKLLTLFLKNTLLIIICIVLFASAAFLYSEYFIPPQYTASVKFFIDPTSSSDSADLNAINYAQRVIYTYVEILKTNEFAEKVGHEVNYIPSRFSFSTASNDVEIIKATVYANSPEEANKLIEAVKKLAPTHILDIIGNKNNIITPFDPTYSSKSPSSPNVKINVLIGVFLGFIISSAYIILKELLDTRIKNSEELTLLFSIPILGTVPNFVGKNDSKKGGKKHEWS